jgi:hypothetical protein
LNKFKKAISVGMSAALLASLMATIAAPIASASITGTSAGNVAQGSTSVGTASYLFTENSIAALPNAAGSMTVTITPAAPGVGTVTWSGTPVVSAPGSLGATASVAGNVLTINVAASDPLNVETISISGLKVTASATASPGAVVATLSAGLIGTAFSGGTVTATGKLAQAYGIGTTVFAVANDLGSCPFSGTNNVTVGTEVLTGTTVSGPGVPVAGQQTFTTAAMTNNHLANEVVSQTVPNCNILVLSSPATVVQALAYTSHGIPNVFPGENNSLAAAVDLVEPAAGFLAAGNVITYTIDTAGVVFSSVPAAATLFAGDIVLGAPVLSADRKSVTITVTTASTVASGIHFSGAGLLYDVAATVPAGTFISLTATATGKIVLPASVQNAVVFRGVVASAPMPTVYIGENNQATGLVTVKEQAAGFFQAGTGPNNVLSVCPTGVAYSFTFAPWARVVGGVAAGNVILREGAVASPDNIVMSTPSGGGCFQWTVWSASTTASTIEIGADGFASGPLINVTVNQNPGLVAIQIRSGNGSGFDNPLIATVGFATAAYRVSVGVAALSQTALPAGALGAPVGDLAVWETGLGQLKAGEVICVEVLPRAGTAGGLIQDVFLGAQATAALPIVTTTGTGLVVGPVSMEPFGDDNDECGDASGVGPATQTTAFSFTVLQQSVAGDGRLVISNIRYTTTADAADGLIQVRVSGANLGAPTMVAFQQIVSNARIGAQPTAAVASRLGVTQTGVFTTSTKVAALNKYVTFRFDFGVSAAGKTIQILGATKTGNDWSPFANVTSRVANASGVVYYYIRQSSATWKSYRAYWAAAGIMTAGGQARWR